VLPSDAPNTTGGCDFRHIQLLKLNFVPLAYFTRCLDYDSLNLIIQQRPPVFHRKHNVVMYLPRAMARFMNNRDTFHPSILNPKPIPVASHGESQVQPAALGHR
jgi:hypothetical protein